MSDKCTFIVQIIRKIAGNALQKLFGNSPNERKRKAYFRSRFPAEIERLEEIVLLSGVSIGDVVDGMEVNHMVQDKPLAQNNVLFLGEYTEVNADNPLVLKATMEIKNVWAGGRVGFAASEATHGRGMPLDGLVVWFNAKDYWGISATDGIGGFAWTDRFDYDGYAVGDVFDVTVKYNGIDLTATLMKNGSTVGEQTKTIPEGDRKSRVKTMAYNGAWDYSDEKIRLQRLLMGGTAVESTDIVGSVPPETVYADTFTDPASNRFISQTNTPRVSGDTTVDTSMGALVLRGAVERFAEELDPADGAVRVRGSMGFLDNDFGTGGRFTVYTDMSRTVDPNDIEGKPLDGVGYEIIAHANFSDVVIVDSAMRIVERINGVETVLAEAPLNVSLGDTVEFDVVADGQNRSLTINGVTITGLTEHSFSEHFVGMTNRGPSSGGGLWKEAVYDVAIKQTASNQTNVTPNVVVNEDFSEALNTEVWTTEISNRTNYGDIRVVNGAVKIAGYSNLVTAAEYAPSVENPLTITGVWTPVAGEFESLKIYTRSTGGLNAQYGNANDGIFFHVNTKGVFCVKDMFSGEYPHLEYDAPIQMGQTYTFEVTDNGNDISFALKDTGGNVVAELSGQAPSQGAGNYIVFSDASASHIQSHIRLDDVKIVHGTQLVEAEAASSPDIPAEVQSFIENAQGQEFGADGWAVLVDSHPNLPLILRREVAGQQRDMVVLLPNGNVERYVRNGSGGHESTQLLGSAPELANHPDVLIGLMAQNPGDSVSQEWLEVLGVSGTLQAQQPTADANHLSEDAIGDTSDDAPNIGISFDASTSSSVDAAISENLAAIAAIDSYIVVTQNSIGDAQSQLDSANEILSRWEQQQGMSTQLVTPEIYLEAFRLKPYFEFEASMMPTGYSLTMDERGEGWTYPIREGSYSERIELPRFGWWGSASVYLVDASGVRVRELFHFNHTEANSPSKSGARVFNERVSEIAYVPEVPDHLRVTEDQHQQAVIDAGAASQQIAEANFFLALLGARKEMLQDDINALERSKIGRAMIYVESEMTYNDDGYKNPLLHITYTSPNEQTYFDITIDEDGGAGYRKLIEHPSGAKNAELTLDVRQIAGGNGNGTIQIAMYTDATKTVRLDTATAHYNRNKQTVTGGSTGSKEDFLQGIRVEKEPSQTVSPAELLTVALDADVASIRNSVVFETSIYYVSMNDALESFYARHPEWMEANIQQRGSENGFTAGQIQDSLRRTRSAHLAALTDGLGAYNDVMAKLVGLSIDMTLAEMQGRTEDLARMQWAFDIGFHEHLRARYINEVRGLVELPDPSESEIKEEAQRLLDDQLTILVHFQREQIANEIQEANRIAQEQAQAENEAENAPREVSEAAYRHNRELAVAAHGEGSVEVLAYDLVWRPTGNGTYVENTEYLNETSSENGEKIITDSGDVLSPMTPETLERIRDLADRAKTSAEARSDAQMATHFQQLYDAANGLLTDPNSTQRKEWIVIVERMTTDPERSKIDVAFSLLNGSLAWLKERVEQSADYAAEDYEREIWKILERLETEKSFVMKGVMRSRAVALYLTAQYVRLKALLFPGSTEDLGFSLVVKGARDSGLITEAQGFLLELLAAIHDKESTE